LPYFSRKSAAKGQRDFPCAPFPAMGASIHKNTEMFISRKLVARHFKKKAEKIAAFFGERAPLGRL
jgi:hypothetical protein